MSVSNLIVPNDNDLFCDTLTANTLNINNLITNSLTFNGANQTPLSAYEEFILPVTYGGTMFAVPPSKNIRLIRIGKIVTMHLESALLASAGPNARSIIMSNILPARFRPYITPFSGSLTDSFGLPIVAVNDRDNVTPGYNSLVQAELSISPSGGMSINVTSGTPTPGVITMNGIVGIQNMSFNWLTAF